MKNDALHNVLVPLPVNPKSLMASSVRSMKWEILARHRSRPHLERKFYHFVMGMICFSLYAFVLDRSGALWMLSLIGGPLVLTDLIRLKFPKVNTLVLRYFGKMMRREELKSVSGNSFYVLGLLLIVALFPKPIVLLSVIYLAVGDPIAAVIGSLYGKHKIIGKKSLEGAFANWVCSSLGSFAVGLGYFGMSFEKSLGLALVGGTVSVLSELCPAPVDDNFTIPVFSATLLSLYSAFIPLF